MPTTIPRRRGNNTAITLARLADDRCRLLELFYTDRISADRFQEKRNFCKAIESARTQAADEQHEECTKSDLELRFEQVASILKDLDIEEIRRSTDDSQKRILVEELVEWVAILPDH